MSEIDKYSDMYDIKHFDPLNHPRMPISDRAAQFLPFAALNGFEESIFEAGREKTKKVELGIDQKELINNRLQLLLEQNNHYEIIVKYFVYDDNEYGHYEVARGYIHKVDLIERMLILKSKEKVPLDAIVEINSPLFTLFEQDS